MDNQKIAKSKTQAGPTPIHSALVEGTCQCAGQTQLRVRLYAWARRRHSTGISHSAPFIGTQSSQDAGPRARLLPLACAASCPDRVLALSLSADCYANYGVQLSSAEFQPNRLVAECTATKACTSSSRNFLIGQP